VYRTGEAKEVEMNRNLNSQFQSAQEEMESDSQRARRVLIEDCPSFDLGFHSQSQGNACDAKELHGTQLELVVVSSNDDSGDTLDKIYSNIELPTVTPASEIKPLSEEAIVTSAAHSSCTPVPQAHQKRVVKLAQNQKSPFVQYDKTEVATKFANEVYSRICSFGGDTDDEANNAKIIDYGTNYVYLRDLADSVRPRAWLSNSTCDLALHVLRIEMAKQKKHVMPLRLAVSSYKLIFTVFLSFFFPFQICVTSFDTDVCFLHHCPLFFFGYMLFFFTKTKLSSTMCLHDRFVKKQFKMTTENRLDHKEQVSGCKLLAYFLLVHFFLCNNFCIICALARSVSLYCKI
jgi:hypothetical protein